MTALSLFDLLQRSDASDTEAAARLGRFADRLVESVLVDLDRLRRDEQDVLDARAKDSDDGLDGDVNRSLWDLYARWSQDAEHVLVRVRRVAETGHAVRDLPRLEDAYGTVRARLSVSPESVMRGREQVRTGQGIPAKELRESYALDVAPEARRAWLGLDVALQEDVLDELDRLAERPLSLPRGVSVRHIVRESGGIRHAANAPRLFGRHLCTAHLRVLNPAEPGAA